MRLTKIIKFNFFLFITFDLNTRVCVLLPRIVKYIYSLERKITPPLLSLAQCSKCSKGLTPRRSQQRQVSAMSCDISKVTFSSRWVDWWGLPPSKTITQPLWHRRDAGSFGRATPLSQQRQVLDMSCDISKQWFSSRWVDWWGPQRPTGTLWKICNLLTS